MMLTERVCIFPDTRPRDELLFPLVQLFAHAVYMVPVENDQPDALPPLAQELLAQGSLQFHCPALLGADRDRFLHLISELWQRPGEYAALALTSTDNEAESQNAITSTVRRQATTGTRTAQDDALWQARVVLKLAELAEQQEEEVRQSLRRLALREQELFSKLRDLDGPLCCPTDTTGSSLPDGRRMRLRLKAWRTLFSCSTEPPSVNIFITADRDTFDSIMEERGTDAQTLLKLPLPAVLADSNFTGKRDFFRQEAAVLINRLFQQPANFSAEEWNTLLTVHYPASEHGRCRLSLHFLSNIGLKELFGGSAAAVSSVIVGLLEQEHGHDV